MKNPSLYLLVFLFFTTNLFATITIEPPLPIADISCGEPLPAQQVLSATTDCPSSGAVVSFIVDPYFEDPCGGTFITYRWIATDNCGDFEEVLVSFLILPDVNEPIFTSVPSNITVECDGIPSPSTITAVDDCSPNVTITYTETVTFGVCSSSYDITRTWVAVDDCGNSTTVFQNVFVEDNIAPLLLGIPADVTVECDNIPSQPTIGATDNCDTDVNLTFSEIILSGVCPSGFILVREWTATDDCGNAITESQTITVDDFTAPIMSGVPANITVECDNVPSPAVIGTDVTASDNCDPDVEIMFNEITTVGPCTDSYILTREWTATDNCGNQTTGTQIVTVEDNTTPVFDFFPSAIADISCGDPLPTQEFLTASDNCDPDVIITYNADFGFYDVCTGTTVTYVWIATDACGNATIEAVTFNILPDVESPVFDSAPSPIADISCGDPFPSQEILTASDNCSTATVVSFDNYTEDCVNGYVVTYTWIAEDECGNITQIFTSFNVLPNVSCDVPTSVSSLVISGNVVKLSWTGASDANRYRIRYRPVGGSWTELLTGGAETFRFINALMPNTTYQYQVKSLCTSNNSAWSSTATFTTLNDICDIPSTSGVTNTTSTSTTVYWSSLPNDIKYRIKYKAKDYSNPWTEVTLNPTTYNLTGLTAATNYKYKLKTKCSNGWSNWSGNFNFSTPANSSSEVLSRKINTAVQVFPNPASDFLQVRLQKEATNIRIHNLHGKVLKELSPTSTVEKIDVQNWSAGMYILTVRYKDGTMNTEQFVKIN